MNQKLNWGIIGWGNISKTVANCFKDADFCQLGTIASKTKKNFSIVGDNNNISFLNNYEELINNNSIDAIYIGTTNDSHKDIILKSAQARKHIICEKPACLSSNDFQECVEVIKSKNIFFAEGIMYLHHPQILKAIDIIKQGEIGQVTKIKSSFGFRIGRKFFFIELKKIDRTSRLFNPKLGGGVINDLGCYPVTAALLFSDLENSGNEIVKSTFTLNRDKFGIDETGTANLLFKNDIVANLTISIRKKLIDSIEVFGNLGSLRILNPWANMQKRSKILLKTNKKSFELNVPIKKNIYSLQLENVAKNIIDKKKEIDFPCVNINKTLKYLKILDNWKLQI